ncbi:sulfite exporter TauE/SafE family protein, partial [Corynebacterium heidelbergense]
VLMGALGGGGAILAIPLFIYGLGFAAHQATVAALLIVGIGALSGVLTHVRARHVAAPTGLAFGALGIGGSYLGPRLSAAVDEAVLLTAFAALVAVVAGLMAHTAWRGRREGQAPPRPGRWVAIIVSATTVGFLTGFFGVGGGFAIVPALTLVVGLEMPLAVGTSLLVILLNTLIALLLHGGVGQLPHPGLIAVFAAATIGGTWLGSALGSRASEKTLRLCFAALLAVVSVYTAARSIPMLR